MSYPARAEGLVNIYMSISVVPNRFGAMPHFDISKILMSLCNIKSYIFIHLVSKQATRKYYCTPPKYYYAPPKYCTPHQNITTPHQNITTPHQNITTPHQNIARPTKILQHPTGRDCSPRWELLIKMLVCLFLSLLSVSLIQLIISRYKIILDQVFWKFLHKSG